MIKFVSFVFFFCGIYIGVPDVNWSNSIMKQTMPIFHKILFKHIFHKRKSLYMLPKGKCICMLKRKFCVASFWFLTIVLLFVFVFFSFTPALKALNFCICKSFHFFFLRSESNLHFPQPAFGRSGCRLFNSIRSYFYPTSLTFGDGQIR